MHFLIGNEFGCGGVRKFKHDVDTPEILKGDLVGLYGCETWSLTLRQEHRLRVFENKVLRKIFGAKRDDVTG